MAIETSEAERRAQDAERELINLKKVAFMAQHLGDEFDALLISLTKHGFFVELIDLFVEGFVSLESLEDDRYVYRESLRAAVGRHSNKAYRLGDRIRVCLDRVDPTENRMEFSVAGRIKKPASPPLACFRAQAQPAEYFLQNRLESGEHSAALIRNDL